MWLIEKSDTLNEMASSVNCQLFIKKKEILIRGSQSDIYQGVREIEGALKAISDDLDIKLISQKQMMGVLKKMLREADFLEKYNV